MKNFSYVVRSEAIGLLVVRSDKKGSLESETVKYGREPHWTRIRE
jgi:hypothetical protein